MNFRDLCKLITNNLINILIGKFKDKFTLE